MNRPLLRLTLALLLGFAWIGCTAAWAGDEESHYDRVNLSASASDEVENDLLVAVLFEQREGQDPASLAAQVNRAIAAGLERAKRIPGVKVQTLDYRTTPVYRKAVLSGWRVRQSIRLESRDTAALGRLIGDLQASLQVQSIDYRISEERRARAEDGLIKRALAGFGQRAKLIAGELGRPGYRVVSLNVATQGAPMQPMRLRMMAADAMAAPALEPGTQQLNVSVSGTVELKPGE